jgi:hypothetical protein
MGSSSGINYRETYFEFPELTKLQGEPNAESLLKLRNELKAYAQSVYSNLSDGAHGHLALVLSDAQYALLTNQPFVRPLHPGTLAIPDGTTGPMSTVMKEAHHERLRLFREVQGVEKALIQQIIQAIEPPYLASIRDRASNSIRGTVHEVLEHLRIVYGRVSPQMLEDRAEELRTMSYNTQHPVDIVFNAVEDYADFAELGDDLAITQSQKIAKAYIILNKTRRFKNDITDWNRLPAIEKTWTNFKDQFRRAHQELRETTDVTLDESDLQRSNAHLVQQVVEGMQHAMSNDANTDHSEILSQMSNSATRVTESQQQLQAQIQHMQHAMGVLQSQVTNQTSQQNRGYQPGPSSGYQHSNGYQDHSFPAAGYQEQGYRGNGYQSNGYQGNAYQGNGYQGNSFQQRHQGGFQGRGRGSTHQGRGSVGRGTQGGRGSPFPRGRNTSVYCWTHGGCGHPSNECQTKIAGHQSAATFENKMGGSTRNCPH